MIGVIRRQPCEDTETQREPCEDRGSPWSDTSTSQGTPRIDRHHQKLGGRHETDSPLKPSEVATLINTVISLPISRTVNKFLLFAVLLCSTLLRQL